MAKANLSIIVTAVGALKAAQDIGKVDKSIVGLSKRTLGTTIRNVERLGIVAGGVLASQVMLGIRSLEELESATTAVDGAIKQLGLTGQLTGEQVATWANEIETAVGAAFDDKAITAATATLLRYGKVTPGNLRPAMEVMTDLAAKTGSVEAASTLLAKALADPEKAAGKLARQGIVLTKAQQATVKAMVEANDVAGAQAYLLDELAKTTKGAALASQGPFKRSMAVLRDVIEDAQRALAIGFLPVLQRVAEWLSKELAKPAVINNIKQLGQGLARAFDQVLSMVQRVPWGAVAEAMKLAGQGAKVILDMFTSLPPWVQTAVITGWGLNKLTGGGLSAILGQLAGGLVKGVLGVNAGVVNAKAGVVNVAGPVAGAGGAAGAAGRAGGGLMRGMVTIGTVALAAGSVYELAQIWSQTSAEANQQAQDVGDKTQAWLRQQPRREDLVRGLAAVDRGLAELNGTDRSPIGLLRSLVGYASGTVEELQKTRQSIVDQLATLDRVGGNEPGRGMGKPPPKPPGAGTANAIPVLEKSIANLRAAQARLDPNAPDYASRYAMLGKKISDYALRLDEYRKRLEPKTKTPPEATRADDTRSEATAISRTADKIGKAQIDLSPEAQAAIAAGLPVPTIPALKAPAIPPVKIDQPKVPPLAVPDLPLLRVEKQDALKVDPPKLPPLPVPTIPPLKVDMPPPPTLKIEPPRLPPLPVPTIPPVKVEPPGPLTVQPPVIPPLVAPLIPPLTLAKDTYERINAAVQPRQLADDTRSETIGIRRAAEDGRRATDLVREEQRRLARFGEQTVAKTGEVKSAILSLPERIAAAMPRPLIPAPVVNVSSNTTVTISAKSVDSARTTFVRWGGSSRHRID